jgi:hypothetical protein
MIGSSKNSDLLKNSPIEEIKEDGSKIFGDFSNTLSDLFIGKHTDLDWLNQDSLLLA